MAIPSLVRWIYELWITFLFIFPLDRDKIHAFALKMISYGNAVSLQGT